MIVFCVDFQIKLWIFPEGTRHNTAKIHQFKKGAFHLAIEEQLPILPVVFSKYYFLDERNRRFDYGNLFFIRCFLSYTVFILGKVIVTPLPLISTEGMTSKDVDDLTTRTREIMESTFQEVNKEISEAATKDAVSKSNYTM